MNQQIHSEEDLLTETNLETDLETVSRETEQDTLVQQGFSSDEIMCLLWLRQWYQNGGSDRTEIIRHLEFLKLLVLNGKMAL